MRIVLVTSIILQKPLFGEIGKRLEAESVELGLSQRTRFLGYRIYQLLCE